MRETDILVTGYRCHGFALARGVSPEAVMAELFGRRDGCAHGRGGSMHLLDVSRGYYGGWGIVGGQLPLATGPRARARAPGAAATRCCASSATARSTSAPGTSRSTSPRCGGCRSSTWSSTTSYGMGTSVERASAEPELHKRASAYRMHGEAVDGDDLEAMLEATERLLDRARDEREPAVLEAITYRYRGHSVADAGLAYRTREEIKEHQEHDPLVRVAERAARGRRDDGRPARRRRARGGARARRRSQFADAEPGARGRRARRRHVRARAAPSSSPACGRAARSATRS